MIYAGSQKKVKCGAMDPHTPHSWGIGKKIWCDGKGLR
jgi:hypothetical protein